MNTNCISSEKLKNHWQSPIYSFFKPDITLKYYKNHPCHFFKCAAKKCKTRAGGVCCFQDSKDRASTANLKSHAIHCFGADAVNAAIDGKKAAEQDGSISTLFAHNGKRPVWYLHRVHSNPEVWYKYQFYLLLILLSNTHCSVHLIKRITENNWLINIINDHELRDLLMAGHPSIDLPSTTTISRDIKTSFEKCWERIAKLLQVHQTVLNILQLLILFHQEHPGHVHFATDTWTLPNHCVFVAWTVHLEYQGEMLSFLLDIIELPEVCYLYSNTDKY